MPSQLTTSGLSIATQAELLAYYTEGFQTIYGPEIDLDSDTPDGQAINLNIQAQLDVLDLIQAVYTSMDPDQAFGNTLDLRVAINGIQRQAGTYTITNITVITSQSVNLYGLDQVGTTGNQVFTVADSAGNQYQLQTTQTGLGPATSVLAFQAANAGAVIPVPNTITTPVTIVLGVASVNNPTAYTTLGINEETDAELKVRRQKSVSIPSQGAVDGLLAGLENIAGVTFATVVENYTAGTVNGVPSHSIWVIVAGSGAAAAIAQAIYVYRSAGCGMYNSGDSGAQSYSVTRPNGSSFTVYWDTVITSPLFISFTTSSLQALEGTGVVPVPAPPNLSAISTYLVNNFTPGVYQQVNTNDLATLIQEADPNTLTTSAGFSISTVQTITFSGTAASGNFKLNYGASGVTSSIAWNASAGTIQSDLQAITGLSSVTVTGSISSGSLVVTMTGVATPSLIGVSSNTLQTSAPAAITLTFTSGFTKTLLPTAQNLQFTVAAANIIMYPMILGAASGVVGIGYVFTNGEVTSTTLTIVHAGTFTFVGAGGYGAKVYSCSSGTGGTIGASTGIYTAGTAGTDTITLTDFLGATTTCTVTVT